MHRWDSFHPRRSVTRFSKLIRPDRDNLSLLPALVSGALTNTQFSSMVIDILRFAHILFDDFTNFPAINMWESTFTSGTWVVYPKPVATLVYNQLLNPNWGFRDSQLQTRMRDWFSHTAYCAFSGRSGSRQLRRNAQPVPSHREREQRELQGYSRKQ